ncbi:ribonuclease H-like domain-containing protein [Tanacetum coccineum]|uniref:Ribonuclease H-like domain-containing protein n=1 Tax=Tanacetum coccineum TaxID=301880 RepID=A0ABQ5E3G1_9ASTR
MESQSETTQTVSALKLPILKTGDYDLWSMRMEQYITHTDYALWEVIVNGDAPAVASASAEGPIPPKTAEQKLARKNELKAKSTLLLAIPDEHLLKFHRIKNAKTLWETIKTRSEGLDKTNDRFQKLISQLEIHVDLYELSMDDLYNNLKVYEAEIKSQSSSISNSQNGQASSSTYANDVMFSLFANQFNSPQLDNKDLEQIDTDDLEEMDLKWQVAMLTMRVKRFLKKTGRNLNFNSREIIGFDKTKFECYNCHRRCHFARECRAPRNHENRNGYAPKRILPVETPANALVVQDGIGGYDWSFQAKEDITNFALMTYTSQGSSSSSSSDSERDVLKKYNLEIIGYQLGLESLEARIVIHQKNEAVYEEDIAFLKYDVKSGVGFDSQMNENELHDCHLNKSEVFKSASDSSVNEIEEENNQVNDRFKKVEGYHVVPPPYTGNYMPSRPDLSFAGLDDSIYKTNVSETISSVPRIESTASKSSKDSLEQPKDVRPSAPIIEEWESDSDDDCVIRPSFEQNKPSYAKINFVKSDENTKKSVIEQHTYMQAENLKKSQIPKDNRRNWKGMMNQKLRNGFEFIKKACFVCGSFNHLIKDCDFHDKKIVEKPVLNNKGRVTGQREVRPVWNNAQRVNHQNKLTHPHPKRNFVPTVVATKVWTSARNAASPTKYSYFKAHSPLRGPFNQKSATKTNNFNKKVYTAKINNVTTVGPEVVVSTAGRKRENIVKSSACWIWRPTGKVIDHISKDSGSYMPKRFDYVDPQGRLKHMTGNKSYLIDYQDIDGGFVAFSESPKRGKITGKGKIRTGKLDFEDVYFVKELKFNLFSISQMCDKKNNVLFTETECLVLSPNFKLLDERGLTCLIAKSTIDESNLWHRRLGHINFKTMNKLVRGNLVRGQHLCDNGTEFKNSEMNQFCKMKGIKREFSVARTPQQNGVAKRKNRTLIEAARTMLADSLLPTTFWAKAINTACYVQNRVLIMKPHNKTTYELLIGRSPNLDLMIPFGCLVTILNTLDHLGKFEGKADEGFLVGYSVNSKAFRVFNTRTKKVEENLHIKFLENKPNVAGSGPEWLFDIDSLTKSMNYEPVTAGNQTNDDAGIETNVNAVQTGQEKASNHKYILLPFLTSDSQGPKSSDDEFVDDAGKKNVVQYPAKDGDKMDEATKSLTALTDLILLVHLLVLLGKVLTIMIFQLILFCPDLEDSTCIFRGAYDDADVLTLASRENISQEYQYWLVLPISLSNSNPKSVIQSLTDPSWIEAMQEELLQFKIQKVWTLVDLPKGKRAIRTKWVTDIQEKDKNQSQNDKTEHENRKTVRSKKDQVKVNKKVKVNVNPGK